MQCSAVQCTFICTRNTGQIGQSIYKTHHVWLKVKDTKRSVGRGPKRNFETEQPVSTHFIQHPICKTPFCTTPNSQVYNNTIILMDNIASTKWRNSYWLKIVKYKENIPFMFFLVQMVLTPLIRTSFNFTFMKTPETSWPPRGFGTARYLSSGVSLTCLMSGKNMISAKWGIVQNGKAPPGRMELPLSNLVVVVYICVVVYFRVVKGLYSWYF